MVLDFILCFVVLSHALACLARDILSQQEEANRLRREAAQVARAEDAGEFARRFVEVLWASLYALVSWRLVA